MRRLRGFLVLFMAVSLAPVAPAAENVARRRTRVNEAAGRGAAGIPVLEQALNDENALVRRAAVRSLIELGEPATMVLETALDNPDLVVRRAALIALVGKPSAAALPYLTRGLSDKDITLREATIRLLVAIEPRTETIVELLRKAEKDEEAPEVQRIAVESLRPFQITSPDTVLLRDRPDMADHVSRITELLSRPLPREGWRLRLDPGRAGHIEKWQNPDYDDSAWNEAAIEEPWTAGYIGVGWYRLWLDLPERPKHLAAELHFEGVDESAWVWVNGIHVGGQDIGPSGWNRPFRVDATEALRWNARNQITVRAMNTTGAGGIYKPITLQVLGFRP